MDEFCEYCGERIMVYPTDGGHVVLDRIPDPEGLVWINGGKTIIGHDQPISINSPHYMIHNRRCGGF